MQRKNMSLNIPDRPSYGKIVLWLIDDSNSAHKLLMEKENLLT